MVEGIFQVAIDGPAGAGKSTMAKLLAKRIGAVHIDTGSMYRALGFKAIKCGVDANDEVSASSLLCDTIIDVILHNGTQRIILDGVDVTSLIRSPQISQAASKISQWPKVRKWMVELQQDIARGKKVVMDGRDICAYVLPEARYKFFLGADSDVRAKRRFDELIAKNKVVVYDEVLEDIRKRDYRDCNREYAPLKQTEDALFVDSTNMSICDVIDRMVAFIDGDVKK